MLTQHRRSVELAAPVLKALSTAIFPDENAQEDVARSPTSSTKRQSQQKRKQSSRANRAPTIDSRPFSNCGLAVPLSKADADAIAATVLEEQMDILKVSSAQHIIMC